MRRKLSWTDGQTDRGITEYPPPPSGSGGYNYYEMHGEEKSKLRSHNTSYCLIEVATKAGLTVTAFLYVIKYLQIFILFSD